MKISLSILKGPENWKWRILDVWDFSTSFWINRSDPWIYFRWRAQVTKEVISILMQNTHWWSINWRCGLATLQGENYFLILIFWDNFFAILFCWGLPEIFVHNFLKEVFEVEERCLNHFLVLCILRYEPNVQCITYGDLVFVEFWIFCNIYLFYSTEDWKLILCVG